MSKVLRYEPCNVSRTVVPQCSNGNPNRVHEVLHHVFDGFPRLELDDAPVLRAMFEASGDPLYHELAEILEANGPVVIHLAD